MAKLPLRIYPDPVLRTVAAPVTVFDAELTRLVDDMLETMYASRGIGLAAPQVGVSKRILVMDVSEDQSSPEVYINPDILLSSEHPTLFPNEGCLSFPGVYESVARPSWVKGEALNVEEKSFNFSLAGLAAQCLQHEIDHLDGKLLLDKLGRGRRRFLDKKFRKR